MPRVSTLRAIMPRPSVTFPYDGALHDVDRQLLANGITTEFHGVTLSWEGGLRGEAYAERMFAALDRMRHIMGARHYVHLRFETHHIDGVDTARQWIRDGRVRFVALNDHLPSMARRLGDDRKLLQYADRAECDLDTFQERIRRAMGAADSVADARDRERQLLARSVDMLTAAASAGRESLEAVEALHFTNRVWTALVEDLGSSDNALPKELRANLISVGLWLLREAEDIRQGRTDSFDSLIEVSQIIRDGLQ